MEVQGMNITLVKYPSDEDWMLCKKCALVTVWKEPVEHPTAEWKHKILEARHSPIRVLRFMFYLEGIPYCNAMHLCRHVHAQPFVSSQRNDRQNMYDRNEAKQNAPVNMYWEMSSEELMQISNKRLCNLADEETRNIVKEMCALVEDKCPEFKGLLVPMCEYNGWVCHEMKPCGHI